MAARARFGKTDPPYRILRDWIAAGMPRNLGSGDIKSVRVTPAEAAFKRDGEKMRPESRGHLRRRLDEDITTYSEFRTNDENVATVANQGEVHARQAGDTAIVVSYRGPDHSRARSGADDAAAGLPLPGDEGGQLH